MKMCKNVCKLSRRTPLKPHARRPILKSDPPRPPFQRVFASVNLLARALTAIKSSDALAPVATETRPTLRLLPRYRQYCYGLRTCEAHLTPPPSHPMYQEKRDVLEMRKINECDMEKCTLDFSERAIAILGDRWWPQKAKQDGDKVAKRFV